VKTKWEFVTFSKWHRPILGDPSVKEFWKSVYNCVSNDEISKRSFLSEHGVNVNKQSLHGSLRDEVNLMSPGKRVPEHGESFVSRHLREAGPGRRRPIYTYCYLYVLSFSWRCTVPMHCSDLSFQTPHRQSSFLFTQLLLRHSCFADIENMIGVKLFKASKTKGCAVANNEQFHEGRMGKLQHVVCLQLDARWSMQRIVINKDGLLTRQ